MRDIESARNVMVRVVRVLNVVANVREEESSKRWFNWVLGCILRLKHIVLLVVVKGKP